MNNSKEPFIIIKGILLGVLGIFAGYVLMAIFTILFKNRGDENLIILLTIFFLFPCEIYIITSLCFIESEDRSKNDKNKS